MRRAHLSGGRVHRRTAGVALRGGRFDAGTRPPRPSTLVSAHTMYAAGAALAGSQPAPAHHHPRPCAARVLAAPQAVARLRQQRNAATVIATAARGRGARLGLTRARRAATTLAAGWRGFVVRDDNKINASAATCIQAGARSMIVRRRLDVLHEAAEAIQAAARGLQARLNLERSLLASRLIQRVLRGMVARKEARWRRLSAAMSPAEHHAALLLTAGARGFSARRATAERRGVAQERSQLIAASGTDRRRRLLRAKLLGRGPSGVMGDFPPRIAWRGAEDDPIRYRVRSQPCPRGPPRLTACALSSPPRPKPSTPMPSWRTPR